MGLAARGKPTNVSPVPSRPPIIAYLFTTFPKPTETFLQREVAALIRRGARLRLYSLVGGGGRFAGTEVRRFSLWRLAELIWIIPWVAVTRWDVFGILLRGLFTRRAPGWLNFWENMLGAGFAGVFRREFRRDPPDLVHAAWGGGPATAAWILHRLDGHAYSAAAHAYDLYEHGGDWWLDEKLAEARFVHTSTAMGRDTLLARRVPPTRVHVIRRGLEQFPPLKPLRRLRRPLRLVAIARLVPKKGLQRQLQIHAALAAAGLSFEARVVGGGPLRARLERRIRELGLSGRVTLTGHLPEAAVWEQLAWADVLAHTGVVSPTGDRDGLPNVIPEAMAAGTLVVSSTVAATREAIVDGETGLLADVERTDDWLRALRTLAEDDALAERIQRAARRWAEHNYDAARNSGRLQELFEEAVG